MITRADIAARLERNIRTGFLLGKKAYAPLRGAFVREHPSDGAFETYSDLGAAPWPSGNAGKVGPGRDDDRTDFPAVNAMNSGEQIKIYGVEENGIIVYNVDWDVAVGVEHNAINDDRVGDVETWAKDAGSNFEKHKDYLCFDALNNGEGTTYGNCYDKHPLFYDSHADPKADYQTAQDNKFALALSLDNFDTVKVAGSKFKDSRGIVTGLNHRLLIHPSDLARTAAQITDNDEDFATANRAKNPYAGKIARLEAPGGWLDSTAWFLIDNTGQARPINLQNRQDPELVMWDVWDKGSGVRYYKWTARYTVFYGDWRLAIEGNT